MFDSPQSPRLPLDLDLREMPALRVNTRVFLKLFFSSDLNNLGRWRAARRRAACACPRALSHVLRVHGPSNERSAAMRSVCASRRLSMCVRFCMNTQPRAVTLAQQIECMRATPSAMTRT
jgi:hypothetical protein